MAKTGQPLGTSLGTSVGGATTSGDSIERIDPCTLAPVTERIYRHPRAT
jgi:hypothetical protein